MNETVTVDKALAKGHRMVNYPTTLIMFGTLGFCFYLGIQEILPFWIIPAGFGFAFGFACLYWGIMITKWRLWAFENVRNVHELKKRAIQEKLIWPDDSIFVKTEIRTSIDKEKWDSLQSKFDKEDIFIDNVTIPSETIIYYSKDTNYLGMAVILFFTAVFVYFLMQADQYIWGSIVLLVGAFLGYNDYKEATNTEPEPQIIINDQGIKTISTRFYRWVDIKNEEAIGIRSGKSTKYYLKYHHPTGIELLQIGYFDTDYRSLNKLLILYRGRNKKLKNSHKHK